MKNKEKQLKQVQESVIRGFVISEGKQPSNKELDSLNNNQIARYKEIGDRQKNKKKKISIAIWLSALIVPLLILLGAYYIYPAIKYTRLSAEIRQRAEEKGNDLEFSSCFREYTKEYDTAPSPRERYEFLSRGYYYCVSLVSKDISTTQTQSDANKVTETPSANPTTQPPATNPVQPQPQRPVFRVINQYSPTSVKVGQPFTLWVETNLPVQVCEYKVNGPDYQYDFSDGNGTRCSSKPITINKSGSYVVYVEVREVVEKGERQKAFATMGPINVTD